EPSGAEQCGGYAVCERGIRVPADDVAAFAHGLARLIENEGLRRTMGERGQQFVEQHHSQERLFDDVAALYRELSRTGSIAVEARVDDTNLEPTSNKLQSCAVTVPQAVQTVVERENERNPRQTKVVAHHEGA